MHLKLFEDVVRFGRIATGYDYPVQVNGRYLMSPSPIPNSTTRSCTGPRRSICSARAVRSGSMPFRRTPM